MNFQPMLVLALPLVDVDASQLGRFSLKMAHFLKFQDKKWANERESWKRW